VLLLALGWLLLLAGAHAERLLAAAGLLLAAAGWGWITARFAALERASPVPDRSHARFIVGAATLGTLALLGAAAALAADQLQWLRLTTQLMLWGWIAPTFVIVSHRMLPFFSAAVLPGLQAQHKDMPLAALLALLALAGVTEGSAWLGWPLPTPLRWVAALVLAAGAAQLLRLALQWGLARSLGSPGLRLLAMLHGGFVWFGLTLALVALSQGLQAAAAARLRARRAHRLGRRHRAQRHADQLLRAAGGRQHRAGRGRPPRHLHRAGAGRRNHAPRRRRGLRLQPHPAAGRGGGQHREQRLGPGQLHARVRPQLRDGGIRRRTPRRADGRAALRPPGHRGLHPRQGQGDLKNFNVSVGVTDAFMQAVVADGEVELVHKAEPGAKPRRPAPTSAPTACGSTAACPRASCGTRSCATYDHAEPGVLFLDRINADNNLATARRSRPPTPAPSSRCRRTAAAAWAAST
jgi:hypothetical protein